MNERIRTLAEQAGLQYGSYDRYGLFDEEKFAQLIVQECCNIVVNEVKKYFGVELMNETEYTLDETWEQDEYVDFIIVCELKKQVDDLNQSLKRRESGHGITIFDHDVDKDVAMIRDRIRSFEQVLDYYGENT